VANHTMLLLFAGGAQTRQVLSDVVGANVPNPNDFGTTPSFFALRSSSSSLSFFRPPPQRPHVLLRAQARPSVAPTATTSRNGRARSPSSSRPSYVTTRNQQKTWEEGHY
jgi:hypothetical protein